MAKLSKTMQAEYDKMVHEHLRAGNAGSFEAWCAGSEEAYAEREMREVQAEGVAFVVCNALGIDSGDYSFGYVAGWGQDSREIMKELEVIRKTANMILDKVA